FLPPSWSFGSSFALPSTITEVQPSPAPCPVQRTILVIAQKHDSRTSYPHGDWKSCVSWTENQCVGSRCFLQEL
ncbi:hypothetical protein DBR06_SOUSAS1210024, partial [Sousa chinensis]